MFKAIIFDRDGVLVDTEDINIASAEQVFEELGVDLDEEDKEFIVGRHPKDYTPQLIEKYGLDKNADTLMREQGQAYYTLYGQKDELKDGVEDILRWCQENDIGMALCTSGDRRSTEIFLDNFDLHDAFEFAVTKDDVDNLKPAPDLYELAAEKLGLPNNGILVIEDTDIGVDSAKAAGLTVVAIPNEYTKNHDFTKADYLFDTLTQIRGLFNDKDD